MDPVDRMDRIFLRAMRFALVASRGGPMRARILKELCKQPLNPLALAKEIGIDYKTATHHLEKLRQQNLVVKKGEGYGSQYHVTFTPAQRAAFEEIAKELGEAL